MQFVYKARSQTGAPISGHIDAVDRISALRELENSNSIILSLNPVVGTRHAKTKQLQVVILACIAVLAILFALYWYVPLNNPRSIANAYLRCALRNSWSGMIEYSNPELCERHNRNYLKNIMIGEAEKIRSLGGYSYYETEVVNDLFVIVRYRCKKANMVMNVRIRKEDNGKWRIQWIEYE